MARFAGRAPQAWGLDVPGVTSTLGPRAERDQAIALTFDACGGTHTNDPGLGIDRDLIEVLRQHDAKATLFLNRRWIAAHPAFAAELAADPLFELASHGVLHRPLSVTGRSAYGQAGTADPGAVYDEIVGNDLLADLVGGRPTWFRSGTAHCDDVAVAIAAELRSPVVNFSLNGDAGSSFNGQQVSAQLSSAKPGDIVIAHMNRPEHGTAEGFRLGLAPLLARGLRTATLSEYLEPSLPTGVWLQEARRGVQRQAL
jgi:peptidoglycan/xylan/chitin deacetylase (PgdA/CDA1 family)